MSVLLFLYQFICFPFALAVTILFCISAILGSFVFGNHKWGYWNGMIWSRFMIYITFQWVTVKGRENLDPKQSYIFTPNHQGTFDIFLIYGYLGQVFNWVMKQELRKLPFLGSACEHSGHIYIDRSSPHSIKRSLDTAKGRLVNGNSLVIFPEGSRTQTGRLGRFKRGAFMVAVDLQLPIVPVTIDGSYRTFSSKHWYVRPNRMRLTFHPPISTVGMTDADLLTLMNQTRSTIAHQLGEE